MSTSETESEPESEPSASTVSSLAVFAGLSATGPGRGPKAQGTVSWAVNTLATLDFRLVRKDTALHGLIQNCASTILALLNTVLQVEPAADSSCSFIPDITSIFTPSFLHLLFQYRRLFHVIAAKNFKPNSTPLAIVCWVDVVLAKLGDVAALIAAGFDGDHPDQSLPESLKAQREEDNLRAAMQLPDNWDMLPSVLSSERVSSATKRLSTRLMLGRYILCPALSGQEEGVDNSIYTLLSTFSEFVRQSAARVDELRLVLGRGPRCLMEQERLASAMAISLFAAADMAQNSAMSLERGAAFRPQTVAAAMQLLRFVVNDGGHFPVESKLLNSLERLDIPTSVIIRWGVVPQWTWNVWLEYRSLYADTIIFLTMVYIQHHKADLEELSEVPGSIFVNSGSNNQAAMISITMDLVSRFVSIISAGGRSKQLSTGMMSVLHGNCRLISQWMNRNSSGIQSSTECCKILIVLFGHLTQDERHIAVNDLVMECLSLVNEQCTREAWEAAIEDKKSGFLESLGQRIIQVKTTKFWDDPSKSSNIYVAQLMQFLVVMMSRGIQPLDLEAFVEFIETVKERILEMPLSDQGFLCEVLLTCLATAKLSGIDLSANGAVDDEVMWRLGMCSGDLNLSLASAFSLYIISSAVVSVEPLTRLEGAEHLADIALLICSRHYLCEDEPLALIVLPTICDALGQLLGDDTTEEYTWENTRMSALGGILRSLNRAENRMHGEYGALLKRRLLSRASGALCERTEGGTGTGRRAYELVFCRREGLSHLLYVTVV